MPSLNLLIKPASSLCNMRCSYCFYFDTAQNRQQENYGLMTVETLENIIIKALNFATESCTIAYQGGEPTLVGLEFFVKSIELQKKHNKKNIKINNAIQTNAYALNQSWVDFFKKNNFLVGVSLDGTKECHDPFRPDANGKGTFNTVIKNIELLKKNKVDFNILTVVNSLTAKKIQSVYNFFKNSGFEYLQFIPCLQPFGKEAVKQNFTLSEKDWGSFLCNLFDLWYRDFIVGKAPHIRQFENYVEMLLGYPPESCGMSGICSYQNVIEANGECYPCDFYVLDEFNLGNLNFTDFDEINGKRSKIEFIENSYKINEKCKACKYLYICRGGCKRYCEPFVADVRSVNLLCNGYLRFFNHSVERLSGTAKAISQKRS